MYNYLCKLSLKAVFNDHGYFAINLLTFRECLISMQNSILNKKELLLFFRPTLSFRDNHIFLKKERNFLLNLQFVNEIQGWYLAHPYVLIYSFSSTKSWKKITWLLTLSISSLDLYFVWTTVVFNVYMHWPPRARHVDRYEGGGAAGGGRGMQT